MKASTKLKKGFRVEIKNGCSNHGCVGRICEVYLNYGRAIVGVEFKNWEGGHSCSGLLSNREARWKYLEQHVEVTNKPLTDFKNI